ncbi:NAD-dependent epimerase/dehydratase family protein [Flavobacterium sp. AJR]|uniref:NAD-dependent epimerase/dehydratase family protein n=1 Tax=Flavobacterium sp. AJR TaxID=1979369 RepID=UPI000A3D6B3E|nr:NAD-dependent epimerase/dehydratase family protein [Flavobacterium sp. AJR]OUL63009.1 nucleoside-diphosphate-sugar epimerase [Flavobacterium sp. AJR]
MKIAITGITGFVGKNVQDYLKTSHEIIPMSVRYEFNQKFEINTDALIHLAGKAHDLKKISVPKDYFDANYELTKQLFDAFLESESVDFIYFSSVKSVADNVKDILLEDVNPEPKSPYGQSKLQAERYILSKEISENKRVFIIRPCMIHGPGNKGNLNLLYNLVKKRIPYPLSAFKNQRSFLGIDNLNFMIKEILENKNVASGVYNFADDEVLSTSDLVQIISSVLDKKNLSVAIPKSIINGIAKIGDTIKLPLNSEVLQKLTENYRVSNQKIKLAIGVDKLPNTTQQGLEKTIKSFISKR